MASRKRTGSVTTAARRKNSRQAGRTRKVARTGPGTSDKPFSLRAQQRELIASRPTIQKNLSRSEQREEKEYHKPAISGPWWSHATQAYRVEFYQPHKRYASHNRESSFYCSHETDAKLLLQAALKQPSWLGWLDLKRTAMEIAQDRVALGVHDGTPDGFLYRIMAGDREVFIQQKG